jgi:hypothetical protein
MAYRLWQKQEEHLIVFTLVPYAISYKLIDVVGAATRGL